jgi:hypothetical protein
MSDSLRELPNRLLHQDGHRHAENAGFLSQAAVLRERHADGNDDGGILAAIGRDSLAGVVTRRLFHFRDQALLFGLC